MGYKPTAEQVAVLDAFEAGDNLSVSAYAGAGKTSTLVDAAALKPNQRGIFTAFNRKIIDDSRGKFGRNVKAVTTHSLASHVAHADGGWRWGRMKAPRVYGRKLALLLGVNDPINLDGGRILHPSRLASLALMMVDRFANSGDDEIQWWHLPSVHGLDEREERRMIGLALVPAANRAWNDARNPKGTLRYTHNYYRKEYALTHPQIECEFFMVDEAQDSAGVLVRLIEDQVGYGTQIITVGDSYQAINGWNGAVDAMDKFDGTKLTLTQSFRFGDAIAAEANKWLELLGADKPLRGLSSVESVIAKDMTPDAVLCRTNGAVVAEVIDRLTIGERVAMLGDPAEITNFTRGARDLMDKAWSAHPDLMAFGSWAQVQEYVDHDEAGADLKVMVDMIDKHGVDVIEAAMRRLTVPASADTVLSTAHKCKGAEWDTVRIGPDFKAPKPDDDGNRIVSKDSAMLNYVAITRAKFVLDRGSLSWVDEVLAEHRARKQQRGGVIVLPVDEEPAREVFNVGPQVGDRIGSRVVVETEKGLATIQPLDLDTLDQRTPAARALLVAHARTPIALPIEPEWVTKGLPGPDWTEQDVADVKAAADARFTEGLRVAQEGTDEEKAKMFGTPTPEQVALMAKDAAAKANAEELEAPVDPLIAETAPVAPKILTEDDLAGLSMEWDDGPRRPGSCGAKHKSWMNTYCLLDPHGPEHLHRVQGIAWDESHCAEPGLTPAHV